MVQRVVDVLPPDSYLAMSIATDEFDPIPLAEVRRQYYEYGEVLKFRNRRQALRFFDGLEIVEPGLVQVHKWHPDRAGVGMAPISDKDVAMYGAVARKP